MADLRIDRGLEVPVGTQLAWKLRTLIESGGLVPGDRLPSLREVAEAAGVNVNTVRAVYQRLEAEGAIETRQGSGTFVARVSAPAGDDLARVVAEAEDEARRAGVDPREVATRLYASSGGEARSEARAGRDPRAERARLRGEIARLESELARHVPLAPTPPPTTKGRTAGELLGEDELREVRDLLLGKLGEIDAIRDELVRWLGELSEAATEEDASAAEAEAARKDAAGRARRGGLDLAPDGA